MILDASGFGTISNDSGRVGYKMVDARGGYKKKGGKRRWRSRGGHMAWVGYTTGRGGQVSQLEDSGHKILSNW